MIDVIRCKEVIDGLIAKGEKDLKLQVPLGTWVDIPFDNDRRIDLALAWECCQELRYMPIPGIVIQRYEIKILELYAEQKRRYE